MSELSLCLHRCSQSFSMFTAFLEKGEVYIQQQPLSPNLHQCYFSSLFTSTILLKLSSHASYKLLGFLPLWPQKAVCTLDLGNPTVSFGWEVVCLWPTYKIADILVLWRTTCPKAGKGWILFVSVYHQTSTYHLSISLPTNRYLSVCLSVIYMSIPIHLSLLVTFVLLWAQYLM